MTLRDALLIGVVLLTGCPSPEPSPPVNSQRAPCDEGDFVETEERTYASVYIRPWTGTEHVPLDTVVALEPDLPYEQPNLRLLDPSGERVSGTLTQTDELGYELVFTPAAPLRPATRYRAETCYLGRLVWSEFTTGAFDGPLDSPEQLPGTVYRLRGEAGSSLESALWFLGELLLRVAPESNPEEGLLHLEIARVDSRTGEQTLCAESVGLTLGRTASLEPRTTSPLRGWTQGAPWPQARCRSTPGGVAQRGGTFGSRPDSRPMGRPTAKASLKRRFRGALWPTRSALPMTRRAADCSPS